MPLAVLSRDDVHGAVHSQRIWQQRRRTFRRPTVVSSDEEPEMVLPSEPISAFVSGDICTGAFWSNNGGPVGNGLDIRTLTSVEFEMREKAWTQTDRMRRTHGYEKTFLMNTCSQIGVRATRLLDAEHVLSKAEAEAETRFDDAIGMSGDDCRSRPPFQIPYRALVPKGIENLLVAGRCAGYTPDLIDRTRLIPVCMVTGQAAGTAAALSVLSDVAVRDVGALFGGLVPADSKVCYAMNLCR